jgi:hypothetical protein
VQVFQRVQQSACRAWAVMADAEDVDGCGQERPSFLKKRSKRLLFCCRGLTGSTRQNRKSFLVLFFKKELLS